ncbi:MAG: hydantoinase/oxoprolinase family protein [Rhodospirillales bacterium]|nr:hydantoinase/oxoprolinase family protein [Rhodospirillales bacterium]
MAAEPRAEEAAPLTAPWRIGVDVGGTFTDLVLQDSGGALVIAKVPSVPADPSRGVMDAVEAVAARVGLPLRDTLAGCALFVHGSTIATNTILEGKGARVGLLTTAGFRDSLEIRRGLRENMWDHRTPFPPVLVPRYLRLPVRGRTLADGAEEAPLVADDVRAAVKTFREEGVDSVAICFLNAYASGAHETEAARIVGEANESWPVSVSSDVMPVVGEYERGSTTVVNAYVAPRVVPYLRALDAALRENGLRNHVLLVQSNGGVASVEQVASRPVNLALSGPAAGVGALRLIGRAAGTRDLLSMEIGGTSCDVMLMAEGEVAATDQLMVGGYHLSTPAVEIHTIGAGGGTIAGVDSAGLLFVGPKGAGARPGPACYGLGGTEPTVTDALLALGRLRPGPYAGGAVSLDAALATAALKRAVGDPLGLSVEAAASGIIRLIEQNLLHAVERLSIERGVDPRRFTLVAAGGAGPMHGASVGRGIGARRVYVPRVAGAFCALGMLHSDIRQDWVRVFAGEVDTVSAGALDAAFAPMEAQARATLVRENVAPSDQRVTRTLDLRYPGQQSSLRVDLGDGRFDATAVRAAFEAQHTTLFGHIQPGGRIAIVALRVAGIGHVESLDPRGPAAATGEARPIGSRSVWVDDVHGWKEARIYAGADLRPGHVVAGPLVVEEATTTVFAGPGDTLRVDAAGNFDITLGSPT